MDRRNFLSGRWVNFSEKSRDEYFSSIDSCYAFLAEVPLEDLQNEAAKRGIPFEGYTKFELAKVLFSDGQYRS